MRNDQNKTKRKVEAHGEYSSTAKCRTKIPAIFRGVFGILRGIPKLLFMYSTTPRGAPNNVLWNSGWEALQQT
jgi:hypothetical protein